MPDLEYGDFTGGAERRWIMATLRELCGGRVWATQVPDDVDLVEETEDGLKPYLLVRFAAPASLTKGASIADGEQDKPHLLSFSLLALGNDADSVEAALADGLRLLVGKEPSHTAHAIKARGGFGGGFASAHTGNRPTRFEEAAFLRCQINT